MFQISETSSDEKREEPGRLLKKIAWEGAWRMLPVALEAEVGAYIEAYRDERDNDGKALVVRNGRVRPRKICQGRCKSVPPSM